MSLSEAALYTISKSSGLMGRSLSIFPMRVGCMLIMDGAS